MTAPEPLKLGWFATGAGATSPKLLDAALNEIRLGTLNAKIAVVFCNREPGEDEASDRYHALVRDAGITLVALSDQRFRRQRGEERARKGAPLPAWRADYDREVIRLLLPYPFDLGVLAGYKLIFGAEAANTWDLLNLHPAEPGGPKGIWQDVIWALIETQAQHAGVMIHLATPELDEGPPVTYCTYPIRGPSFDPFWEQIEGRLPGVIRKSEGEDNLLFRAIREAGVAREVPLMVETLRACADGRARIRDKRLVGGSGEPTSAVDLTPQIEALVAANA